MNYGYRDLVSAHLSDQQLGQHDNELGRFHHARFLALTKLFDLEPDWPQFKRYPEVKRVFDDLSRLHGMSLSPFSKMLEAPRVICEVYQALGPSLNQAEEELKRKYHEALCDIFARTYGGTNLSFTSSKLKELGASDDCEPDPDDWC